MKSCNMDLSEEDVQRLMYRFDSKESQRFEISNFVRFLKGRPPAGDEGEAGGASKAKAPMTEVVSQLSCLRLLACLRVASTLYNTSLPAHLVISVFKSSQVKSSGGTTRSQCCSFSSPALHCVLRARCY